ncbi:hypothetical protein EI555_012961 [Monodon monoceros]|uniref:DUF1907 domain-containing protein n=1 Tax=Monodon monoceros TaxID=40151 RepID=A0A4U1FDT3_MONMO|nr:hypothetical protein EI555_012961 [Monodon monoceros]
MSCAEYSFHVPSLEELVGVLRKGLMDNFADVQVSVVDCPNLTKEPFTFPVKGICGKTRIAEAGGAGPFPTLGFNSEFMPVVQTESEHKPPVNGSYFAHVNSADGGCLLEKYSEKYHDLGFALLANLFAKGKSEDSYIMPAEFSSCPLNSDEDVNKWLRFYEMKAPLVCLPVFISRDPGFDLRLEHTHCFSHHGEGGHYHYDNTPDIVEYLGYFLPAEFLYRIDQPTETHSFGQD